MAELRSALAARQRKGEEDRVFEGYGKRKFTFKEGKRGANVDPEKVLHLIQVKGVESPTEPLDIQSEQEERQHCDPEEHHQPSEQQHKQQHQEQQQQNGGHGAGTPVSSKHGACSHTPSPKKQLILAHRHDWASQFPLHFAKDQKSPEVQAKAREFEGTLNLPMQVALRIALVYQFKEDGIGERIANVYLEAIKRLRAGVKCSKLCHSSLKVKRKMLRLHYPEAALSLKTLGIAGFFSGSTRIDFHTVKDLYIGTRHSVEFREVNAKIKPLGQMLQESRCCVLSTTFRTYSLLMDRPADLAALCAVVDVSTGRHGPAVWGSGGVTDAVFATGLQARRIN